MVTMVFARRSHFYFMIKSEPLQVFGYLIPEFPGQTHSFFRREIEGLRELEQEVSIFSTRLPNRALKSHEWSDDYICRTTYLFPFRPLDILWALVAAVTHPRSARTTLMLMVQSNGKNWLKLIALYIAAHKLHRSCRRQAIDHVHVHSCGNAALIGVIAKSFGRITYSLTLHNPLATYGDLQEHKWRNAKFAIVITQTILREVKLKLAGNLPTRIAVAPMGVDPTVFTRDRPYVCWDGGAVNLFCCARLNRAKGYEDLLRAVRILTDRGHSIRLVIAGEDDNGGGGYRKTLESQIEGLSLEESVQLLGAVGESAVRDQLQAAHFFVLASHAEPLGVVLLEAMLMGVPCIATSGGGVPELIEHCKDGWLVPPQEPGQIANAVEYLLQNPSLCLQMNQCAAEKVGRDWTSRRSAKVLKDLVYPKRSQMEC